MSLLVDRSNSPLPPAFPSNGSTMAGPRLVPTDLKARHHARPDPFSNLKEQVRQKLIEELDVSRITGQDPDVVRAMVEEATQQLVVDGGIPLSREDRIRIRREIADEVLALGPIQPLLDDPTVSEVMVNGPDQVYFERDGVLYPSDRVFRDEEHIMQTIDRIVAPLNRRVDESSPMVDARLADGSRVNAIIPPLAIESPILTIRKFAKDPFQVADLIRFQTLTPEMAALLRACIEMRLNMVISGGTGTGKTTLLNVLSSFIPSTERIVTIEDPAELQLRQRHVLRLETRPANIEGSGEVTQRDLVRNALRMRPDRILVGEVRAGEAFDMLQAMNTGHDGSLTTVHANSPRDALSRIENMVLMAGLELPAKAIREQVASAIDLIIHLTRMRDGSRRVTHVSEIVGMESQTVTMQDIFVFQAQGVDSIGRVLGGVQATGLRPRFTERAEELGIELPASLFEGGSWR